MYLNHAIYLIVLDRVIQFTALHFDIQDLSVLRRRM